MEPTPPKANRTKKSVNRPFYETSKKTSAEIVSEARSTVKSLQTRRPETPHDINKRSLFGSQREGRPPSAVRYISHFYYFIRMVLTNIFVYDDYSRLPTFLLSL